MDLDPMSDLRAAATIGSPLGFHARNTGQLASIMGQMMIQFPSTTVFLSSGGVGVVWPRVPEQPPTSEVDWVYASALSLGMLDLPAGGTVDIHAEGPDAVSVADFLCRFLEADESLEACLSSVTTIGGVYRITDPGELVRGLWVNAEKWLRSLVRQWSIPEVVHVVSLYLRAERRSTEETSDAIGAELTRLLEAAVRD
jgi:phosphotransferase system HPr-like phosphotransfer protein